jgi:heme-degrading monooxygenase HmoA
VALLASRSEADRFRLVIEFESEELRLKWVASDLHQRVWPKMETHFINYTLKGFTGVERPLDHAALWRSTSPLQPAIMGWFRD